jgi:hypothetical protein
MLKSFKCQTTIRSLKCFILTLFETKFNWITNIQWNANFFIKNLISLNCYNEWFNKTNFYAIKICVREKNSFFSILIKRVTIDWVRSDADRVIKYSN